MNGRIKKVRKVLDLTQQEFADRIGISRNNIATYEAGKSKPGDAALSLICREFNVNEEWLRTGKGEMFIELNRDQAIDYFVRQVLQGETDNFKRRLISALSRLGESDWAALENLVFELTRETKKLAPAPTYEQEARAAADEVYRQVLLEKKAEDESSASPDSIGGVKMA